VKGKEEHLSCTQPARRGNFRGGIFLQRGSSLAAVAKKSAKMHPKCPTTTIPERYFHPSYLNKISVSSGLKISRLMPNKKRKSNYSGKLRMILN
jgi:hypothetical protein